MTNTPDSRIDSEIARREAEALADAYERAAGRIESALERAARSGTLSFSGMVDDILADLARLGTERLLDGVGLSASPQETAPPSQNETARRLASLLGRGSRFQ